MQVTDKLRSQVAKAVKVSMQIEGYRRSINYGFNRLRFTGTVPAGARVRLRAKMLAVEPKADTLTLRRDCTVEVEGQDKPAIVAEWLTLLVV